ncbi:MAG: hypothetical protein DHS20C20_26870 [Ardenticatenaceae bacterium]|nr:MAG: hypothetical protein DHS20C20_26870 [Ardenticatenaceae bacterium]
MQTQSISTTEQHPRARFLRRALQANALFSLLTGFAFVLASGPIAKLLGPQIPGWVVIIVGFGLLPFGFMVYRSAANDLQQARLISVMDIAWVFGSFLLLGLGWSLFSVAGRWFVGLQAEAVFTFAVLQMIGLRRLKK